MIASIWGMNVHVPGQGSMTAFWIVIAFMGVTLSGLLYYFRKRGFL
ncbi:MAG: CorA family divalent cation transporter [Solirubrobacteraceae bacterium]